MLSLWNTIFYEPLYNALVAITNIVPGGNVGFSVIILTILVKIILFPLFHSSLKTQRKIKELEPVLATIRDKYKDKETQAKKTIELYQKHNINPFTGCLVIILQIPIILALYWVFFKGIRTESDVLYSFINFPEVFSTDFLGINLEKGSIFLAVLAGLSQFVQAYFSIPKLTPVSGERTFKDELARSMNIQMRYFLPILIAVISIKIPSAVALYLITSNIFSVGQELLVRRSST